MYSNKERQERWLALTTMDIFDLVDIQRVKHLTINKYYYKSKALKMRSRIDFFLIAKNLTKYVQKVDIQPSIAHDHRTVYPIVALDQRDP